MEVAVADPQTSVFSSFTGRTYLLALLISMMTVYSPAYTIGVPDWGSSSTSAIRRWTWVRLFAEFACVLDHMFLFRLLNSNSPRNGVERALLFPAIGTVAGCWLGIIPIALDWDRPWQVRFNVATDCHRRLQMTYNQLGMAFNPRFRRNCRIHYLLYCRPECQRSGTYGAGIFPSAA